MGSKQSYRRMEARQRGCAVSVTNQRTSTSLRLCRRWTNEDSEKAQLVESPAEAATTEVDRPQAPRLPPAHPSMPEPPETEANSGAPMP